MDELRKNSYKCRQFSFKELPPLSKLRNAILEKFIILIPILLCDEYKYHTYSTYISAWPAPSSDIAKPIYRDIAPGTPYIVDGTATLAWT